MTEWTDTGRGLDTETGLVWGTRDGDWCPPPSRVVKLIRQDEADARIRALETDLAETEEARKAAVDRERKTAKRLERCVTSGNHLTDAVMIRGEWLNSIRNALGVRVDYCDLPREVRKLIEERDHWMTACEMARAEWKAAGNDRSAVADALGVNTYLYEILDAINNLRTQARDQERQPWDVLREAEKVVVRFGHDPSALRTTVDVAEYLSEEVARLEREQSTQAEREALIEKAADFPASYKAKMIEAYPVIAGMTADEAWLATPAERDAAFARVLSAKNLTITHQMFLDNQIGGEA